MTCPGVEVSTSRLSLFPSEVGTVDVGIDLPEDFPAGLRQVAVHVQSENDPTEFALAQITLDVGTRSRTTLRVDPVVVTGGSKAQFALVIANDGNSTVQARPEGLDPEDKVEIGFEPLVVLLPPGRREVVQANVRGGRGSRTARPGTCHPGTRRRGSRTRPRRRRCRGRRRRRRGPSAGARSQSTV